MWSRCENCIYDKTPYHCQFTNSMTWLILNVIFFKKILLKNQNFQIAVCVVSTKNPDYYLLGVKIRNLKVDFKTGVHLAYGRAMHIGLKVA